MLDLEKEKLTSIQPNTITKLTQLDIIILPSLLMTSISSLLEKSRVEYVKKIEVLLQSYSIPDLTQIS